MFSSDSIKGFNKLTKDQQFFALNFLKFAEDLYKKGEGSLIDIYNVQNRNASELLKEIANVMLKYNISDDKINIALLDKRTLTKELDDKINSQFDEEYKNENKIITDILTDIGKQKYNVDAYLLSLGKDFCINSISDGALKKVLNNTIEGKTYSDRIWDNKNKVAKQLKVKMRDFLSGNINCNDIEKEIRDRFKVNKSNSERLVRNEIARVQNQVNEEFFKDNDGEYLLYSATLDFHICDECKGYDGKVYGVNEDRPVMPLHTNCRCTYILLPDKDYRPSMHIDNITKKNIDYKSYKEWYEVKEKELGEDRLKVEELKIKNKSTDKKQYVSYRDVIGKNNLPKSFAEFQELKYTNINEWNLLKDYEKSRESNMISAFTSFDDYKYFKNKIEKDLVGLIASNGIEIKSQSKHFIERVVGTSFDPEKKRPRDGVDIKLIQETLTNPLKVKEEPKKNSHKFIGEKVTITINPGTGNLIQCNPTDADLIRRLKRV